MTKPFDVRLLRSGLERRALRLARTLNNPAALLRGHAAIPKPVRCCAEREPSAGETRTKLGKVSGGWSVCSSGVPSLPQSAAALRAVEQSVGRLPAPIVPALQTMPKPEAATIVRKHRSGQMVPA